MIFKNEVIEIFKVLNGGLLTTVQDLGRYGYQKYGLSVAGATDHYSHRMANILVCNEESSATLEITLMGLKLEALTNKVIAITGGDLNPYLNNEPAPMWKSFLIKEGDVLHFKRNLSGCRSYLAVSGGINVDKVLGSRSTDLFSELGGYEGRALKKGDIIHTYDVINKTRKYHGRFTPSSYIPEYLNEITVRVVLGPQDDAFTKQGLDTFFSSTYTVSKDSDRMACRLEGEQVEHLHGADIKSEGMFSGAIQVPRNGLPIVFQAGRASVGGYTKIGGVISIDQSKIAQLKPGDKIRFKKISLEEAHNLYREEEKLFNYFKVSY